MAATVSTDQVRDFERVRDMFIQRWGEMGDCWGINRTMAEIHALLYISPDPLCTDDIMERLQISRGNASMNLRGLVDWGLISRVHKRGDRKEYFVSETNVWSMFETITRQRKKREIEPVIDTITECMVKLDELPMGSNGQKNGSTKKKNLPRSASAENENFSLDDKADYTEARLDEMLEFLKVMSSLFDMFLESGEKGVRDMAKFFDAARKS